MSQDEARMAVVENDVKWIREKVGDIAKVLQSHVEAPPCGQCINQDKVNTNRRLIWWTWAAVFITFIKGFVNGT